MTSVPHACTPVRATWTSPELHFYIHSWDNWEQNFSRRCGRFQRDFSMNWTWGWTAGAVLCCLPRMWQTTWLMRCWSASSVCRCAQKCGRHTEPLLERIFFFFFIARGRAAAVSKGLRFWCSRGFWAFEPSSQRWRSSFCCHSSRHEALDRKKN